MAMRYPGGFISSTAPTVNANTAKGIWTLEEAMQYIRAGQWPVPTGNGDPYFQYNTMLLPGQGTNGANNNTFLDSSTNNFTITRNGNTTQGTFTPFSGAAGYWGNYFDGSGDFLSASNNAAFDFGSGNFTIEGWIYLTGNASTDPDGLRNACLVSCFFDTTVSTAWQINIAGNSTTTGTGIGLDAWNGTTKTSFSGTANISQNAWNHIAVVRNTSTLAIYLNGVSLSSTSISVNVDSGGYALRVGALQQGGAPKYYNYFPGFISNLRIVKGTAVYTSAFTPSTSPLTAISGTSLLTCQSNRFVDNSTNAFAITRNGDVTVTPFQPFGAPTVAYSASTIGGSGYFDGTGDFLSVANNAAFNFGSGAFTIEFWYYPTTLSGTQCLITNYGGSTTGFVIQMGGSTAGSGKIDAGFSGDGADITSTNAVKLNSWNHIAISGTPGATGIKLFINGAQEGSTYTGATSLDTSSTLLIGEVASTNRLSGYLSGLRLLKGTAQYTTTFTPPTEPPTAIANTSLLLNYTNAGIIDNAQKNDLETVGGAQISTTQYKWGASSMYFDGTGDYLIGPSNPILAFGTGDFTVECWVYLSSSKAQVILDTRNSAGSTTGMAVAINSSNNPYVYLNNTTILTSSTVLSLSTWTHLAFVKTAGVVSIFVNGNQAGSVASSVSLTDITPTIATAIDYKDTSSTYHFHGYINDLRVTKGFCRYPYNFTAPTAAFPLFWQAAATPSADPYFEYTTLLLPGNGTNGAQNNTFLDSSTNAFTITRNGNTTQGTFTPFSQTGWGNYFSATGDNLRTGVMTPLGSGDFTLECWINPSSFANYRLIWDNRTSDPDANGFAFGLESSGKFYLYTNGGFALTTSGVVVANAWTHVALVRSATGSGNIKIYINGIADSTTGTNTANFSRTQAYVGNDLDGTGNPFVGYISNMRATTGALYTSNFTPSTSPLTTTVSAGTCVLLTCQSNRFVDNSASAVSITVAGASVQAFSPFNPTAAYSTSTVGGSGYFDGSGDVLSIANTTALQFGTGDFTVEAWVYLTATPGAQYAQIIGRTEYGTNADWMFQVTNSRTLTWYMQGSYVATSTGTIPLNAWTQVAVTRSGSSIRLFINGTIDGTATNSGSTENTASGDYTIGADQAGDEANLTGYIASLRVTKGGALYTSNFTPSTAPLTTTVSSGTVSLLTNFTNAGIIDNTAKNNLETVGGASISTAQSKFGGSSMYFDGSGDYLSVPHSALQNMAGGDITIECWVYVSAKSNCTFFAKGSGASNWEYFLGYDGTTLSLFYNGNTSVTMTDTISLNTWTHVAMSRYGSSLMVFINGIRLVNATYSGTTTYTNPLGVGAAIPLAGSGYVMNGYIQDFRLTKGIARYTTNFTPPTTAFLTL